MKRLTEQTSIQMKPNLSECRAQLLKVSWEICFCWQVLYCQEGGQRLDQISCQVDVISFQSDLIGQTGNELCNAVISLDLAAVTDKCNIVLKD